MARPLDDAKKDGTRYKRSTVVEAIIDAALAEEFDIVMRRAQIRDRKSPEYLSSECLVHLIRDAGRRRDDRTQNTLLPLLLARCMANLISKVPDGTIANAHVLRKEILSDFSELFAIDGSAKDQFELDFFEVRFNLAFQTFRITRVRAEFTRQNSTAAMPEESDEITLIDDKVDNEVLAHLADAYGAVGNPEDRVFRTQVFVAINALPDDERKAVVLCHLLGFKQESDNPQERTAATICDVDGRTIRNRLKRAIAKLSALKEGI